MNEQNSPDVSHKEATAPTVPLIQWKSLHELASRVRQNEPWRKSEVLDEVALHRLPVLSVKLGVWQAGACYIPAPESSTANQYENPCKL